MISIKPTKCPDNAANLLLNPDGVDHQSAIDRGDDPLYLDVAILHRHIDDVSDVGPAIINVAGDAAPVSRRRLLRPIRFVADHFKNASQWTSIIRFPPNREGIGPLQKLEAKRQRIGAAFICDFIDERFAGENARWRKDGPPETSSLQSKSTGT